MRMKTTIGAWIVLVASGILVVPVSGFAVLGGDASSIEGDRAHVRGTLRVSGGERYAVHEIEAASGTVVREYVAPNGTVFAIAWQGPWFPDLRALLGPYFAQYALAARASRVARRPLLIQEAGLVVQAGGRLRAFVGRAYVPQMLPDGVASDAIR
jgi:hypothetical protein